MDLTPTLFVLVLGSAILFGPRSGAVAALLVGCCYMTVGQGLVVAGLRFPVYRMLIGFGVLRVLFRHERFSGKLNAADWIVIIWAVWSFLASFFQPFEEGSGPEYTLGSIYNICGVYFLFRCWIRNLDEARQFIGVLALVLFPVAAEMILEKLTGKNLFSVFGGVSEMVVDRGGRLRAAGPFRHPILAGTVGAVCFPLVVSLWNSRRVVSVIGALSCIAMVFASASSGPMMSWFVAIGCLLIWRMRVRLSALRWLAFVTVVLLEIVTTKPVYFLLDRIDLSGGSTGRHRAELWDAFFRHFSEWWLVGTSYTRHWMLFGVSYTDKHVDITSYYISFGINGGLVAFICLLLFLWTLLRGVERYVGLSIKGEVSNGFFVWCIGAGMLAHASTSISVSYFDQSVTFFWLNGALLGLVLSMIRDRPRTSGAQNTQIADALETIPASETFGIAVDPSPLITRN